MHALQKKKKICSNALELDFFFVFTNLENLFWKIYEDQ